MIAISLTEIASGRRPKESKKMLSWGVGARRSGLPAPQAELGKNSGVSGNKPTTNECFLGGFPPFSKTGSSTFPIFKKS